MESIEVDLANIKSDLQSSKDIYDEKHDIIDSFFESIERVTDTNKKNVAN